MAFDIDEVVAQGVPWIDDVTAGLGRIVACLLVGCAGVRIHIMTRRMGDAGRIMAAVEKAVSEAGAAARVGRCDPCELLLLATPVDHTKEATITSSSSSLRIANQRVADCPLHPIVDILLPPSRWTAADVDAETDLLVAAAAADLPLTHPRS